MTTDRRTLLKGLAAVGLAFTGGSLAQAATAHEPHRIAFYLYELAAAFHGFWAKGRDEVGLRFVNAEDTTLTMARLALVGAVRQVLVNGLGILGVSAPAELS